MPLTTLLSLSLAIQSPAALEPAYGTLRTRWAAQVSRSLPHPEYPRPQMFRKGWVNLNGPWNLSVERDGRKETLGKILVPFPVESQLSGVQKMVPPDATVVYERSFVRPKGDRVLLHFGAVDWHAVVLVNGKQVGEHRGGYTPFSFDITPFLTASGPQKLTVRVQDPTDSGDQPRGKQVSKPGGIFYTPTTGIWQTTWLESVPDTYVDRVQVLTSNDGMVTVTCPVSGSQAPAEIRATILDGAQPLVATRYQSVLSQRLRGPQGVLKLRVPNPKLWSPSQPHRYTLRIDLSAEAKDSVDVPFAFREVRVGKASDGKTRILLNGKPVFMAGPLDQGFWPDGLYTAPNLDAMLYDLKVTKQLGFNMIRKHVKVEPDTWYDACDRMGILVMQDMPSRWFAGDKPTPTGQEQYFNEQRAMVETLRNHPSVVTWVPYNEGWGQYDTEAVVRWLRAIDPTRLIDDASGWTDMKVGDMVDMHNYPGPGSPAPEPHRAAVLGEFGGLGYVTPGHTWKPSGWGYQSFKTHAELQDRFDGIFRALHLLIGSPGLSAAVYTQTTDVETELNGLMTYDRAVLKVDPVRTKAVVAALQTAPPVVRQILGTALDGADRWKFTLSPPTAGWAKPGYDDRSWQVGEGGFGTKGTPGARVRTEWNTPDIWLRRRFILPKIAIGPDVALNIHHDEDAEVYLDGVLLTKLAGYTSDYGLVPLPATARALLIPGPHVLSIHCHQTTGGQYIDAGLVDIVLAKR